MRLNSYQLMLRINWWTRKHHPRGREHWAWATPLNYRYRAKVGP